MYIKTTKNDHGANSLKVWTIRRWWFVGGSSILNFWLKRSHDNEYEQLFQRHSAWPLCHSMDSLKIEIKISRHSFILILKLKLKILKTGVQYLQILSPGACLSRGFGDEESLSSPKILKVNAWNSVYNLNLCRYFHNQCLHILATAFAWWRERGTSLESFPCSVAEWLERRAAYVPWYGFETRRGLMPINIP